MDVDPSVDYHAAQPEPVGPGHDGRLYTAAFFTIGLGVLVLFTSSGMFLPTIPRFVAGPLGGDGSTIGLAVGSFSLSSLLLRPFAGRFADSRGRRPALILGALVTVIATFGHLLATNLAILVVMRLALGAGEALFFVGAMAAATDLAPEHRRGEAISLMSLALYLGVAIGPILGELILKPAGYSVVWIVAGVIAAVAAVLTLVAPETLSPAARASGGSGALLHRRGLVPGLLVLCGTWGMGAYFAFLPIMGDSIGLDGVSGYLALFAIIVVGLRILGAKLPDRIGAARLSGTALVISAVGLAIGGIAPTALGLGVATVLFAIGVAFTFPAIVALAVIGVAPSERGAVVGTASLFIDVAFGLSPAVLGLLAGVTGYPPTFLVSAVFAAAGAAYLLIRRPGTSRTAVAV
jgi:MFS family permease